MVPGQTSIPPNFVRRNMPPKSDEVKTLVAKWSSGQATSPAPGLNATERIDQRLFDTPWKTGLAALVVDGFWWLKAAVCRQNRYSRHSRAQTGE